MKMNIKLKTLKRGKRKQRWNIARLRNNNIPFQRSVEHAIRTSTRIEKDDNKSWIDFKEVIIGSATEQISYEKEIIRKSWISKDMTNNVDERRNWKNKNNEYGRQRYRQLNN